MSLVVLHSFRLTGADIRISRPTISAGGIVNPLMITKTSAPKAQPRPTHPDDDEPGAHSKSQHPTRGMGAMGKIVSSEVSARKQVEDRERFGEPSKVVLLEQMVGSPEEVDDDLSGDVGEECSKQFVITPSLLSVLFLR